MTADEVREYGFDHVAVATGSRWRADGVGRQPHATRSRSTGVDVLTPDDLFAGARPAGDRVVLYDDDHYYLGGALAELLAREGKHVTLVTPAALVSEWTVNTMEQPRIHKRLVEAGVELADSHAISSSAGGGEARLAYTFTRARERDPARLARARHRAPAERRRSRRELGRRPRSATRSRRERSRAPCGTAAATRRSSTRRRVATTSRSSARW